MVHTHSPFTCVVGAWQDLQHGASQVREAVFVQEQGIAREDEYDARDALCIHALVCDAAGQPVATARLLPSEPGPQGGAITQIAHIGRVAVLRTMRGRHLGEQVMQALQQHARQRGDTHIVLSAQTSAAGFYRRLGYQVISPAPYLDCGIAHQDMRLDLRQA